VKLFFATTNAGKLRELEALSHGLGLEVSSLLAQANAGQVEEIGDSFAANALLKAEAAARRVGGWALADDSGLCVDALDGAPGIRSARWSGAGDVGNNARLLEELAAAPDERRGAEYRCALALADDHGQSLLVQARCRGRIARAPRGDRGFGYDPLFELPVLGRRTFGEATDEEKAAFSHRAKAFQKLLPLLKILSRKG
jgi:XTP/dITP diphosphohydrolase